MFYALLKWVLVLALLVGGAFFLATGLGVVIPLITYKGLQAHGVPVGILLVAAGVALAAFWKVSISKTVEETQTQTSSDGSSSTTHTQTTTVTTLAEFDTE